jgi:glycosyltransferase involved in cell wall biosynthesis
MNKPPRITVITACFNGASHLADAINSVRGQTVKGIEYIVIDGGSDDGSVDIIKANQDIISHWVSEPDQGIADAWNKGLRASHGDIIGILNADDLYEKNTIEIIVENVSSKDWALCFGTTRLFETSIGRYRELPGSFDPRLLPDFGFFHTTCFVPRAVYDKVGFFDERYTIAVDTDFLFRCLSHGVAFKKLENITYMRSGGLSERRMWRARMELLGQMLAYGYSKKKVLSALLSFVRFWLVKKIKRA